MISKFLNQLKMLITKKWKLSTKSKKQPDKKVSAEKPFPAPYSGAGSALYYFISAKKLNICNGAHIDEKTAENIAEIDYNNMKPGELFPHYLRYVMKNLDSEGLYRRTDKQVREDLKLSCEDKAYKAKKKAIELGLLVPRLEKKQYLSPQKAKINRYLNDGRLTRV